MQKLFIISLFLISTITMVASPIPEGVDSALNAGNAKELASHFNASIDLNIPNNEGVFSKAQAELILKTFFQKNKPKSYTEAHHGDSKNSTYYSIGNLKTSTGAFRTYILYKKEKKEIVILELRIEELGE